MLRAITFDVGIPFTDIVIINAKLGGVICMFGSIALLVILPWLDSHPIRSARFRPLYKLFFLLFAANFLFLGYIGGKSADATLLGMPMSVFGMLATSYYYAFFLVILPVLSKVEKGRELPPSIHQAVLKGGK